ncbi:hypothetical protein [Flavobacterium caeni]|uniref:hypothetical protein n=1 Tax=Flavobacterium caeni TaxID=490189 RepID=UPI00147CF204|nr:hypothetical protein [Flavobacterium caeni]
METHHLDKRDRDDSPSHYDHRDGSEEVSEMAPSNRDVSGNDMIEEHDDDGQQHRDKK